MRSNTTEYYLSGKTVFIIDIVRQLCKSDIVHYHHRAIASGYIHGGEGEIDLYNGRFGKGIIVKYNHPLSHRYCFIEYYLTDSMDKMRSQLLIYYRDSLDK